MRPIDLIVIHCSATPADLDVGRAEIDEWHRKRGWRGVGYHYVIRRSGALEHGRPETAIGAHAEGYNARSIGVCLVGGVRHGSAGGLIAESNFTAAQWVRLRGVIRDLHQRYPDAKIVGHRDLNAGKECPSFSVRDWLAHEHILTTEGIAWDSGAAPEADKTASPLLTRSVAGATVSASAGLAAVGEGISEHAQMAQYAAAPFPRLYVALAVLVLVGLGLAMLGRYRDKQRRGGV